jgi:hypothetical protein
MVNVTFRAAADVVRLFVDGVRLPIDTGRASKNVADGEHAVQWFVRGDAGDDFSVEVVSPAAAARKITGTFDVSGHDAGTFWFLVEGE